jgi:RNA polymerase sigma-70 factor (ECF subfamily)
MNTVGIAAKGNSAAWVRDLSSRGEVQAVAIDELGDLLRRAALYTLSRAIMPASALPRAQVEQIAEACTRESVQVILDRLPEFRPESKFTTWAYKFVVRHALAAIRSHIEPMERAVLMKESVEC